MDKSWTTMPIGLPKVLKSEVVMRKAAFAIFLFCSSFAFCEEDGRLAMVGPPAEDEAVKNLLNKVSKSCSDRDFRGFMDCFTPSKAASIQKRAENAFICGKVDIDIQDFFVISADEESISFGLRYLMIQGDSPKVMYCSKMVAKRYEDSWRIDYEHVRSSESSAPSRHTAVNNPVNPAPKAGAGQGWRFPNAANGGEEAWLPKDILYMPGPSCANGNCRRR